MGTAAGITGRPKTMITRITRLLLLIQFLIAAGIAALAHSVFQSAIPALALGIGTVLMLRMLINANNFMLARRFRSRLPIHCRIGWWQTCQVFAGEFRASMLSSSWTMPFHAFAKRIAPDTDCLPALLIHGYGCNSGYWHGMSKALSKAAISHYAIDMEPVAGSIDDYVPAIQQAVQRICAETCEGKIVLVAHSMGGLAARAYLRVHGTGRIAKVVTLGTPHHGTALAHFGVGLNTQQMRWTATEQEGLASEWLRELAASEDPALHHRLFVSIYSHHDNIISPQTSSRLEGAKNIELHAIGHVALAFDPVVQAHVIREIRSASARERGRLSAQAADAAIAIRPA